MPRLRIFLRLRQRLEDWVDVRIAAKRLRDLRQGKSDTVPLKELMRQYGLDDRDRSQP